MDILRPPQLKKGDTIAVVAPAHPFPQSTETDYLDAYLTGKKELEKMGFAVKESPKLHSIQWWRAGTPKERADDINLQFADPEIKAIIAHDGGNDCISILEHLEFDLIRKNPKPFIGFSNITNIHSALFTQTGLIGFHMGLLTYELGRIWDHYETNRTSLARSYFQSILTDNQPLGTIKPITSWENWREGEAKGILFGGNLSMLDSLIGTPYFPQIDRLKGTIFFWELDNSPSYRIERVLTHLKYMGYLDVISGMIIGKLVDIKPTASPPLYEPSIKEMVTEILSDYNFPILANVDFGHKIAQIPMPIGIQAHMSSSDLRLSFLESAVG